MMGRAVLMASTRVRGSTRDVSSMLTHRLMSERSRTAATVLRAMVEHSSVLSGWRWWKSWEQMGSSGLPKSASVCVCSRSSCYASVLKVVCKVYTRNVAVPVK